MPAIPSYTTRRVPQPAGEPPRSPAVGPMPPLTEQRPAPGVGPIVPHVVHGIVTAGAYRGMRRLLGRTG